MPRIRYLKPEFFTDEDIAELPMSARLTYAGLWCHADKAGRLEDRPKFLKVAIFPYDNVDIEKQLQALAKPNKRNGKPFIVRYEVENLKLIQILKWDEHQKPHSTEKPSNLPPTPPLEDKENGEGNGEGLKQGLELNNGYLNVKEPLKQKHLEYVYLTEEEHQRLLSEFGSQDTEWMILELDKYIGAMPKKRNRYEDHNRVIRGWVLEKLQVKYQKEGKLFGKQADDSLNDNIFLRPVRKEVRTEPSG